MDTKDIRALFLDFFKSKGHKVYDSMPLVPDDASLLFTNAGMVQFKDIFTGKIPAPNPNIATSAQLCIRAGGKHNDLENVGYTARHHTLFEMLGNFSFGAYFKKDAIAYAWEFVTEILGFDKSVLYVTIHESDDEAYELWCEHIESSRIKRMGDKDNFWQMGDTGPCGPCSEIYVDQGAEFFNGEEDYFGGEGDRFLEIWNLVFMQYERSADGTLTPLPKPSIDTGMGLERVVALKEGKISNFDTSLFAPLMQKIEEISGYKYIPDDAKNKRTDISTINMEDSIDNSQESFKATRLGGDEIVASFRVIADHARSVAFLLAQGVNFDKEGRGYVLRRILRRAVRHGYLLGLRKAFLYKVIGVVCDSMGAHYSYLQERKNAMQEQCKAEEEKFFETIESGMALFQKEVENILWKGFWSDIGNFNKSFLRELVKLINIKTIKKLMHEQLPSLTKLQQRYKQGEDIAKELKNLIGELAKNNNFSSGKLTFNGEIAFKLYDTYGFPLDLTQDMLREIGLSVDLQGFEKCMQEQKDRSKAHWKGSGDSVKDGDFNALLSTFGENAFVGYTHAQTESKILALLDSHFKCVESLASGTEGYVMLDVTPFYPESGGPIGDKGILLGHSAWTAISTESEKIAQSLASSKLNRDFLDNSQTSNTILECQNSSDIDSCSSLKSTKSPTSNTANTRIVDSSNPQNIVAKVLDTQKYFGLNLSKINTLNTLKTGDTIIAQVDSSRFEIIKHHSATHLLHYALREILGSHITQAGSLVESNRLRFDFSHPRALTQEELEKIELLVNAQILNQNSQVCETMGIAEAKAKGAMALFGEKYGECVRVITFGDSIELCGGIHVKNTAEIGSFYITKESSVSSGVRRIEAVCGKAAYSYGKIALESIKKLKETLKSQDVLQGVAKLQNALREAKESANKTKQSVKSLDYEEINGVKLIVSKLDLTEAKEAKEMIDRAKNENEKVAILLLSASDGKIAITAGIKGMESKLKAGAWVKQVAQILGGNGGGRDDFATAGGKITDTNKVQEALDVAKRIARESLQ
ncbi:MAG: alanine--tRNA ligase [Helicobacter sp.]|nr:alanine--tRNA ligase [Helicobacter sp.]MDY2584610.1 alanine--tRNA ligase [Helicobacter sp.]